MLPRADQVPSDLRHVRRHVRRAAHPRAPRGRRARRRLLAPEALPLRERPFQAACGASEAYVLHINVM